MPDLPITTTPLASFPPEDRWDDWTELDPAAWPKREERRYTLIPTICFNCEAACGLMAYVDKASGKIQKLEGNPHHPGSRGKNCAKGPATLNQIEDPNRILNPMKRVGERGSGQWERVSWDEVLDVFAAKIRAAIVEDRRDEVMYHVGRPGEDGYVNRVLQAWGCDAHNSHTNVCSSSARLGYALWCGADRPSPDHANAKFILMLSAHLETGHYFNPHAQRIMEGKAAGAKICVIDVRLSNTASKADWWLAPWPGTESLLLLAMAKVILDEGLFDRGFVERWVNWEETLRWIDDCRLTIDDSGGTKGQRDTGTDQTSNRQSEIRIPKSEISFEEFIQALRHRYAYANPEAAEAETGVPADTIREIAREIAKAGSAFATHVWRNAAAGNLGGWQVARCLEFLAVLVGAVGTKGGTNLHSDNKFVPAPFSKPDPLDVWSELLYPREYPLAYHEMSFLLPHMLMDGRGKIAAYFTRVYNPAWTNPDGMMWERVLKDESKIELHAALTPVWSETAQYADYVLPMGNGAERHDLMSQETHAGKWIGFRQPVQRVARERAGETFEFTHQANPGEVWEEAEFWIELSWRIDPDGTLGIRKHFESPYRSGEKVTLREYYRWIFENSVPGLPEAATAKGLTPYEYMSRYGAFEVEAEAYGSYRPYPSSQTDRSDRADQPDIPPAGFKTPSKKLELFSRTMADWGWPDQAMPGAIESQVSRARIGPEISPNDAVLPPGGALLPPHGAVPSPDDAVLPPNVALLPPDDALLPPDDALPSPHGAVLPPDDAGLPPNDALPSPHGAVLPPDDAGLPPNDALPSPHGAVLPPDDALPSPHGAGLPPNDALPSPHGAGLPPDDAGDSPDASGPFPNNARHTAGPDLPPPAPPSPSASHMAREGGLPFVLIPTFRLPTLVHTRSANAKWLYELSNTNPVWMNSLDAERMGLRTGDLIRVTTRIGYYVNRLWVTEGIRPGVVACSHHLGRWRTAPEGTQAEDLRVRSSGNPKAETQNPQAAIPNPKSGTDPQAAPVVEKREVAPGIFRFRRVRDIGAYGSADPDTRRIWWTDGGVHQNLTFCVQPDPVSGQHCWHQAVTVERARIGDEYGDISVDTNKSMEIYREWLAMTKPAPGPGGLRRPLWFDRVNRPREERYRIE